MNFWNELKSGKWVPYTIAVCAGVLLYMILNNISMAGVFLGGVWKFAGPLFIGAIIAYLLDPLVCFFERKGLKRKIAVVLTLVIILAAAGLLALALIPQFVAGVMQFLDNIVDYISALEKTIVKMDRQMSSEGNNVDTMSKSMVTMLETLSSYFEGQSLLSTTSNIGSGVVTFLMSFILSIYYLMGKVKLVDWVQHFFMKALGQENYDRFAAFCGRCNSILFTYISCSLLEALMVGVINCIFMAITRMPYAMLISAIVAITNLAPTFGPIIGCVLGMFILLLVKPGAVIFFLLFTLVLQTIDGYVIKPKLFGNRLGVSSLLILIFLIVGGRIFGVWGLLLAIPISAILQYLFQEILFPITTNRRQNRRTDPGDVIELPTMEEPDSASEHEV